MMATWVPVFDQSFQRIPVGRLREAYAAGFRVMAGYAGGGSSTKWLTVAEIEAWLALGDDTGVAALFEIKGTEPIDSPALGDDHARAARAAWRARGYADHCAISPAVDRNVTVAQARAQLTTYFEHWTAADTCKPIPYVEADAGAVLKAAGVSAGTFTPAAFSWDASGKLTTPDNAPAHVVWTQEDNGRKLAGGTVDIGHIRTDAPIMWKGNDMALTKADAELVVETLLDNPSFGDLLWRVYAIANMSDTFPNGTMKSQPVALTRTLKALPTIAVPAAPADATAIGVAVAEELDRRLGA